MDNTQMNYVVARDMSTGQTTMVPVPAGHPDPQGYLTQKYGEQYSLVDWDGSGSYAPIDPADTDSMQAASIFVSDSQTTAARTDPNTPVPSAAGQPQLTSQEQVQADRDAKVARGVDTAGTYGTYDPGQVPGLVANPNDIVAKDPVTGNPVSDTGWRESRANANRAASAVYDPTTGALVSPGSPVDPLDIYGNPRDVQKEAGIGPVYMSPEEMATANRTVLPQSTNGANAGGNVSGAPGQLGTPYTMTDDVALQSILNNGGGDDDLARLYIDQGGYGNSLHADFAKRNYGLYDDIYALQNPGMTMPGANDMYGNTTEYLNAMGMPSNGQIGALDGYTLWDNQFTDAYMGSERARGSGDNWDAQSKSQYEQVITNIAALQPSMGTSNAQAIMNMVDRSYEDYRQLSLTNDPTVQNMNFVQYLQSIGAEEWF